MQAVQETIHIHQISLKHQVGLEIEACRPVTESHTELHMYNQVATGSMRRFGAGT